ncbi:E3 ubiquitin-protein ligase FANCL-like [Ptychodera flava]|uniref:E3 ubiquitin-protein ligase FANCL-like n=1 Tax=Ptychodera flava TaxID=63121 RepID=UPI00396A5263
MTTDGVFAVCPLLIPQNKDRTLYEGFLSVAGQDFPFRIELPKNKELKGSRILCSWQLQHVLRDYHGIVEQRLQQSPDISSFLVELKNILERLLQPKDRGQTTETPKLYSQLIQQIEDIGWENVVDIDSSFTNIQLRVADSSSRQHVITIHLNKQHPVVAPNCTAELPSAFKVKWSLQSKLGDILHQFSKELERYQDFFNIVDEIDKKTWVLEPDRPNYSVTLRRIALGSSSSLQIDVDPVHPRILPECKFLGADHVINPLREKLNTNLERWDQQGSVLTNLQSILDIEFPSPSKSQKQDFSMECGICYSYRLDTAIPDQVCNDPRCGQPFHQTCLYEWLRALPSSRQSFNTIFGECPYCSKPITVKMAS